MLWSIFLTLLPINGLINANHREDLMHPYEMSKRNKIELFTIDELKLCRINYAKTVLI